MRLFLILALLMGSHALTAKVVSSKTYRIVPLAVPAKSLLTHNSSLDEGAGIVLWTETSVPSQQWTATGIIASSVTFRNCYSRLMLGAEASTAGSAASQVATSAATSKWVLEAIDEEQNIYRIKQKSAKLYLTLTSSDDDAAPQLARATDDGTQQWQFVEVEPIFAFTTTMREEMMDAYIQKAVENKGTNRKTFGGGGWSESEQLEVVLDAYETTGREDYLRLAKDVYNWFNANVGTQWDKLVYTDNYKWYGHDFNDDVMWQVIAVARLGLLSDNSRYVQFAKRNFDAIYERAYIPFTGLMRWAQSSGDPYSTNSCIAGPTEVAACYLGFAGCGEEYFEKARDLYAAQRYTLANQMRTGKVWDSVVWDPETQQVESKNEWASTYNQGTMLGAACMLYKHYGDEQYLSDAKKIMQWTKANLCDNNGIINVCQGGSNQDLYGFKGILMRYVRRYIRDCKQNTWQSWMEKNALQAYCNRSTEGVTSTAWLQKGTAENTTNDFSISTAASAAANVSFPDDPPLPYTEKAFDDVEIITGDVNADGTVDLTDAILIVYHSLGTTPEGFNALAADVNADGTIDLTDAILVIYQSLGAA